MDMACWVLCSDGLLGILEFARVPRLPGRPFDVRHDDEDNDVVVDDDAIPFRFVGLDAELLDRVHELATKIESRRDESLVLVARVERCWLLRSIQNGLQEHMELYLIHRFGFGPI